MIQMVDGSRGDEIYFNAKDAFTYNSSTQYENIINNNCDVDIQRMNNKTWQCFRFNLLMFDGLLDAVVELILYL